MVPEEYGRTGRDIIHAIVDLMGGGLSIRIHSTSFIHEIPEKPVGKVEENKGDKEQVYHGGMTCGINIDP